MINDANHTRTDCRRLTRRWGITLIELTIAVAVFSVLLATSMKMIFAASGQLRANERRLVALETVQALSEQLENTPWEQLSTEVARQVSIPEAVADYLPEAKLNAVVSEETKLPAKRVMVELTWIGRGGQRTAPIRLTTWVFPETLSGSP